MCVEKIYIPLCFYFIEDKAIENEVHNYLHSTMLLLYPEYPVSYSPVSTFTFHYASTLSKMRKAGWKVTRLYLHSTMLLLYLCCSMRFLPRWMIYIPLCFYFIKKTGLIFPSGITNLHSTMLLLYRFSPRAERILWPTFTFHYASTLSRLGDRLRNSVCAIYIPLCFYFIGSMLKLQRSSMLNLHSTMLLLYLGSKSRSL